jgi:ribosomal protein S12 methylthiotransferase accessory factor YcaO
VCSSAARARAGIPVGRHSRGNANRDWDRHSAAEDTPEQLFAPSQTTVARSRSRVAEALADVDVDQLEAWILTSDIALRVPRRSTTPG